MSRATGRSAEVLRARGGVSVEVGTASLAISHIYKDVCGLAQAKGPLSLIYHEPVLEVRFMRGAAGPTSFLTIRREELSGHCALIASLSLAVRRTGWGKNSLVPI